MEGGCGWMSRWLEVRINGDRISGVNFTVSYGSGWINI